MAASSHVKSSASPTSPGQGLFPDKNRKSPVAQDFSASFYCHVNEGRFLMLPIPPSPEHKGCKKPAEEWYRQKDTAVKDLLDHPVQSLLPGTKVLRRALR